MAVTADERFALLYTECGQDRVCGYTVLPLDGGQPRPLPRLAELVPIALDWSVAAHFVVEPADLIVLRDGVPAARCSLAQARCVRIRE